MLNKILGLLVVLLIASGLSNVATAGDAFGCYRNHVASKAGQSMQIASLDEGASDADELRMSKRVEGIVPAEFAVGDGSMNGIEIAGRCGSSNYYCNEAGFTYCCGNSSTGFYCAADVNGCTR